jgi:hypothetical protein
MPLCLLALVGAPLLLSLGASHARFEQVYTLESDWIALDNAAIRLGQSARSVWNGLQKANAEIRRIEVRHHLAHACARVPATAIPCRAADQAAEVELRLWQTRAAEQARERWREGEREARAHAPKARVSRPPLPPVRPVRCAVCGRLAGWEISPLRAETLQLPGGSQLRVRWIGKTLRGGPAWNYAIEEDDDG